MMLAPPELEVANGVAYGIVEFAFRFVMTLLWYYILTRMCMTAILYTKARWRNADGKNSETEKEEK